MKSSMNSRPITAAERKQAATAAIASVRTEGLELSSSVQHRLDLYVQGKISAHQLRQDTLNEVKATATPIVLR